MANQNKIVLVNQSAGYLMIDIANAFAIQYKQVILYTGHLNPRNNSLDKKVLVKKIVAYQRVSTLKRLLSWSLGTLQVWWYITFFHRKTPLFLVSNPPFATLLPLLLPNPFSVLVYDVYPDALVQYGVFKKQSWLVKTWENFNTKVYAKAQQVFTITQGMKKLLAKYVNISKIEVVPIWSDNQFFKPITKSENSFIHQYPFLKNKFIVLYSGNLGRTHPVEIIPQLAALCTHPDIYFLIIGEGEKKKALEKQIAQLQLVNCSLLPWQPTIMLPHSLSSADVALVTLDEQASHLSIPSKTFNYLSVGATIMAISEPNSALGTLVKKYKVGSTFSKNQTVSMLEFIIQLYNLPTEQKKYREKAKEASLYFTQKNAEKFVK